MRGTEMHRGLLVFRLLLLAVLLTRASISVGAEELHVIHGEWRGDIEIEGAPGDSCEDPSGILVSGNAVEITDASGSQLARTELRPGFVNNDSFCSYGFTLWGVPTRDEYLLDLELAGRADSDPLRFSLRDLEARNWSLDNSLETAAYLEAMGGAPAPSSSSNPSPTATSSALGDADDISLDVHVVVSGFRVMTKLDDTTCLFGFSGVASDPELVILRRGGQ